MLTINGKKVSRLAYAIATSVHNNLLTEKEAAMLATMTGIIASSYHRPNDPLNRAVRECFEGQGHTLADFAKLTDPNQA